MSDESTEEKAEAKKIGRSLEDRAKEVGRDGAYVELDCEALVSEFKAGAADNAKMIVIKAARLELSSDEQVQALKRVVNLSLNGRLEGLEGLDDRQRGFAVFRKIFEAGLETFDPQDV